MLDLIPSFLAGAAGAFAVITFRAGRHTKDRPQQKASDTTNQPQAAVIEIVEKERATDNTTGGSVIIPNDIRINGQRILAPDDHPVIIHEITSRADEAAHVTLTLFARRITIAAEDDLDTR